MGVKYGAGDEVFEPVVDELLLHRSVLGEVGLQKIASKLVKGLLELGWGNAEGTLGMYDDNPAIVAAFKENGLLLACWSEHATEAWQCEAERGHYPAAPHKDYQGNTWMDEEQV